MCYATLHPVSSCGLTCVSLPPRKGFPWGLSGQNLQAGVTRCPGTCVAPLPPFSSQDPMVLPPSCSSCNSQVSFLLLVPAI